MMQISTIGLNVSQLQNDMGIITVRLPIRSVLLRVVSQAIEKEISEPAILDGSNAPLMSVRVPRYIRSDVQVKLYYAFPESEPFAMAQQQDHKIMILCSLRTVRPSDPELYRAMMRLYNGDPNIRFVGAIEHLMLMSDSPFCHVAMDSLLSSQSLCYEVRPDPNEAEAQNSQL
jgi:hypothetical protein